MYRIGIDLGGTNIVAGVVDDNYNIIAKAKRKTRIPRPADEIIRHMAEAALEAAEAAGISMDDISMVGVGSPGTCNPDTGVIEYANNLGFENVPMREKLSALLNKEVYIENDANAAALGEALAGAAKGAQSCVCITLGTGVVALGVATYLYFTSRSHHTAESAWVPMVAPDQAGMAWVSSF